MKKKFPLIPIHLCDEHTSMGVDFLREYPKIPLCLRVWISHSELCTENMDGYEPSEKLHKNKRGDIQHPRIKTGIGDLSFVTYNFLLFSLIRKHIVLKF